MLLQQSSEEGGVGVVSPWRRQDFLGLDSLLQDHQIFGKKATP